jgi:hypothetical protein
VKSFVNGPLKTKTAHLHCIPFLEICLILKDLFDGYGKRREGTKCTTQTLNIPPFLSWSTKTQSFLRQLSNSYWWFWGQKLWPRTCYFTLAIVFKRQENVMFSVIMWSPITNEPFTVIHVLLIQSYPSPN